MNLPNFLRRDTGVAVLEPSLNGYQTADVTHGKIMAGKSARLVTREELTLIPPPEGTTTFRPIAHHDLISMVEETLAYRKIDITAQEFALSNDGMRLFALLELYEGDGVRFALGLRTANDKSMRLSMVAGYRVMVCSNMAFSGEFKPLAHKHTKNLDLQDSLAIAIDRTQRHFDPLAKQIYDWKNREISDSEAKEFFYDAFIGGGLKIPLRFLRDVHKNYFGDSRFEPGTYWALSNAGTSTFKLLEPDKQYACTAQWGKLLQA